MKYKILSLAIALTVLLSLNVSAENKSIVGKWRLVAQKVVYADGGTYTADSAALNQVKIYTPTMFVNISERKNPQLNNEKLVAACAGGHYSLNGDIYQEFTEFGSYKDYKDLKVKFTLTFEKGRMHTVGTLSGTDGAVNVYDEWYIKEETPDTNQVLVGSWKLATQTVINPDGSVYKADSTTTSMRKIFTPNTVVVIYERIIAEAGNQKIVTSCAGGRYTLKDGEYQELLDFASYKDFKALESKFQITIEDGKLHTKGTLSMGNGQVATYDEWFVKAD
jgi:hypothetical protein